MKLSISCLWHCLGCTALARDSTACQTELLTGSSADAMSRARAYSTSHGGHSCAAMHCCQVNPTVRRQLMEAIVAALVKI